MSSTHPPGIEPSLLRYYHIISYHPINFSSKEEHRKAGNQAPTRPPSAAAVTHPTTPEQGRASTYHHTRVSLVTRGAPSPPMNTLITAGIIIIITTVLPCPLTSHQVRVQRQLREVAAGEDVSAGRLPLRQTQLRHRRVVAEQGREHRPAAVFGRAPAPAPSATLGTSSSFTTGVPVPALLGGAEPGLLGSGRAAGGGGGGRSCPLGGSGRPLLWRAHTRVRYGGEVWLPLRGSMGERLKE